MTHRESALSCVACGEKLVHQQAHRHIARCSKCSGIWMETGQFLSLLREAQPDKAPDELMVHNDGSRRRACPVCAKAMEIGWLDFLAIDQCEPHGVWLDPGELEKALQWQVSLEVKGMRPAQTQMTQQQAAQQAALFAIVAAVR